MATKSEELFERLCCQEGWRFHRIRCEHQKAPDYEIEVNARKILIEVKELQANDEDMKAAQDLEETGFYFSAPEMGKRIASKLQQARKQIKQKRRDVQYAVVVFYDNTPLGINPLFRFDMKRAMYGEHKVRHIRNVATHELLWRGGIFGGQRKMTTTSNTSISALASIYLQDEVVGLDVYHNRFAAAPILPEALTGRLVRHFKLAGEGVERIQDWLEVTARRATGKPKRGTAGTWLSILSILLALTSILVTFAAYLGWALMQRARSRTHGCQMIADVARELEI